MAVVRKRVSEPVSQSVRHSSGSFQHAWSGSFFANNATPFSFCFRNKWEVHFQNASRVGANIAEHAIVSLAQMVERNRPIHLPGLVPYLGSKLSVRWKYFIALLSCLFAVDTLLILLSIFFLVRETDKERGFGRGRGQYEQFRLANGGG